MVVLSQPAVLESFSHISTCKFPTNNSNNNNNNFFYEGIPVIDLSKPNAHTEIVKACEEFGFFKVINHGVPLDFITKLENEVVKFFDLPQSEKDSVSPPKPFGYGNKRIGLNGDVGWIEYLLLNTNPHQINDKSIITLPGDSHLFWSCVNEYVTAVRNTACDVLEMIADGLKIEPRNVLSKLLKDEKSDTFLRLNHYPPCPELQVQALSGRNLLGFGEHTDPQIISVVRSNDTSGLQIFLKDGTWVSVPPDQYSFFINVGDSLQVMTNGRFRSVKHRVFADGMKSRVSMIYLGGPPLDEKIAPLTSVMGEGEESLYKEFTWFEYKNSAYKTKLGDSRLKFFETTNKEISCAGQLITTMHY